MYSLAENKKTGQVLRGEMRYDRCHSEGAIETLESKLEERRRPSKEGPFEVDIR